MMSSKGFFISNWLQLASEREKDAINKETGGINRHLLLKIIWAKEKSPMWLTSYINFPELLMN